MLPRDDWPRLRTYLSSVASAHLTVYLVGGSVYLFGRIGVVFITSKGPCSRNEGERCWDLKLKNTHYKLNQNISKNLYIIQCLCVYARNTKAIRVCLSRSSKQRSAQGFFTCRIPSEHLQLSKSAIYRKPMYSSTWVAVLCWPLFILWWDITRPFKRGSLIYNRIIF